MTQQEVRDTFDDLRRKKRFSPLQSVVISRILNAACPDSVIFGYGSLNLLYTSENIIIPVSDDAVHYHNKSTDKYDWWDITKYDEYVPKLKEIILKRSQVPQAVAVHTVIQNFGDGAYKWHEDIWEYNIPVGAYEINVVISPNSADVELCQPKCKKTVARRTIPAASVDSIMEQILFYCKVADKNFAVPSRTNSDVSTTSFFSGESNTSKLLRHNELRENGASPATAVNKQLQKSQSNSNCVDRDEVYRALAALTDEVDTNCPGSFADGWKEALSTAANKISRMNKI